jgi:DnaK suppressor protein
VAKRDKILGNIDEGRQEMAGLRGEAAQPDINDDASVAVELNVLMALNDTQKNELTDIAHAIEKLKDGTYGTCEGCEDPIGDKRMEALPEAPLCVACKGKQEQGLLSLKQGDGPSFAVLEDGLLLSDDDE